MQLIPVLDLLGGAVVRGVRGERSRYRPIESALVGSAEPLAVARALVDYCAASHLYLADLDAIVHGAPQRALIERLHDALPGVALWLDAGFADAAAARALAAPRIVPVYGSESLRMLADCAGGVLSLDRRGSERLDPAGAWDHPETWPGDVIVMTLERVGSDAGPDLATLAEVRDRARPGTRLVGAGGIRDEADLARAEAAGAAAWLVASALHDQRLKARG